MNLRNTKNLEYFPISCKVVAVTGASGKIGRNLIPKLIDAGFQIKLFTRDPENLKHRFRNQSVYGYDNISQDLSGCDAIVHLAVLNNDNRRASLQNFRHTNVELTRQIAQAAKEAGVPRFVNISSIHALDSSRYDFYSQTKREAIKVLNSFDALIVTHIFASKVIDFDRQGRIWNFLFWNIAPALLPCTSQKNLNDTIAVACNANEGDRFVCTAPARELFIYRVIKTVMDLGAALIIIFSLWWLALLIWSVVKLDSPGPGIFKQCRIGQNRRQFICYKFRTMIQGTKIVATHDSELSSVTKVGSFLRTTKLDELPQIVNLMKREMSLVGPRPCLPIQSELIRERDNRMVNTMLPGITGLAQVNGIDMSDPTRLAEIDALYLHTQSIFGDIKLLWRTVTGSGSGDKISL